MEQDNPGVLVHPPLLYVGALAVGAAADMLRPASLYVLIDVPKLVMGAGTIMLIGGIVLMTLAIRQFRAAGTNVPTNKPAVTLVTDGVYRLSRNPIYVSLSSIFAGLALILDNPWMLSLLVPVVLVMHLGVIGREEKYLTAKFGEPYKEFMSRTRRWL